MARLRTFFGFDIRLPKPSVAHVSQVVTVDKSDPEDRLGRIPRPALDSVLAGLRPLFQGEWSSGIITVRARVPKEHRASQE